MHNSDFWYRCNHLVTLARPEPVDAFNVSTGCSHHVRNI